MEGSRWKAAGRRRGRAEIRGKEGRAPWGGRSGQRPDETGRWGARRLGPRAGRADSWSSPSKKMPRVAGKPCL